MIIVSGFNVYPNEIEDVVSGHPDIVECAAVGIPDEVVWYNDNQNLGIRFFTIPVEDFVYAFSMILSVLYLFDFFKKKSVQ